MAGIRTAIIPAAGLGTRMLPASEAVPKELFPVGGRPAIDWVLDEALSAGIDRVVIVTSDRKPAIVRYLSATPLSCHLESGASFTYRTIEIRFVEQPTPRGLGDAVLCVWHAIADEALAVLLPDELMLGGPRLLSSMLEQHNRDGRSTVALMKVPYQEISSYGSATLSGGGSSESLSVKGFVEKPDAALAPSNYAVCGRYVLGRDVLDALEHVSPDRNGEIQLTEALDLAARQNDMLAVEVLDRDQRVDVGNWPGWLRANRQLLDGLDQSIHEQGIAGLTARPTSRMVA